MKFLLDENFDNDILRGILREKPDLDYERAQDIPEICGQDDPTVLAWAASRDCVLLTHDVRTMIAFASERIKNALPMPGVIVVSTAAPIGKIIEDVLVAIEVGHPDDFENQIRHLPFK